MRKTWKKLGLLVALCGTAVLFACAKPPAAPENTPHLVQQAQTMQGEETLADMVERLSPAVVRDDGRLCADQSSCCCGGE